MRHVLNASLAQVTRIAKDVKSTIGREISSFNYKPLHILAFLTYRCTSRCQCCNIWKKKDKDSRPEMNLHHWIKAIDKLADEQIQSVEIFGGDALLRKDVIFDFIKFCDLMGIKTYFPTNSNLIGANTAKRLVNNGLDEILFSLDGTENIHDNIRGINGSYKKVIKAVHNVANMKNGRYYPQIVINTTISSLNYKCMPAFIDDIAYLPIDRLDLGFLSEIPNNAVDASSIFNVKPEPFFVASNDDSHILTETQAHEFKKIKKILFNKSKKMPFHVSLSNILLSSKRNLIQGRFPETTCFRAMILPTLTPYGDVIPCPFYSRYILGNINEKGLGTIWGNEPHRRFISAQKAGKIAMCRYCNMTMFQKDLKLTLINYYKHTMLSLDGLAGWTENGS